LDLPEKNRLEKLLGMLGSAFDGERANAARLIAAMAEKQKLTIVELIFGVRSQPSEAAKEKSASKSRTSRTMVQALAEIAGKTDSDEFDFVLTDWECEFTRGVSSRYSFDYELTAKQIVIVEKIIRKVEMHRQSRSA
jgi:hypothetical protein